MILYRNFQMDLFPEIQICTQKVRRKYNVSHFYNYITEKNVDFI